MTSARRRRGLPAGVHFLVALAVVARLLEFVVKPYRVPSESMQPTLQPGQLILVDRTAYRFGAIQHGDIVVFTADQAWLGHPRATVTDLGSLGRWILGFVGVGPGLDQALVKRVIGLPGDTVACCDAQGRVRVDGVGVDEPYVLDDFEFSPGQFDCATAPASDRCFPPVTVPADSVLVIGDHRSQSADSVAGCRGPDRPVQCARFVAVDLIVGKLR